MILMIYPYMKGTIADQEASWMRISRSSRFTKSVVRFTSNY